MGLVNATFAPAAVLSASVPPAGAQDNMFSPGEVEAMVRAYNTQPDIFTDMPHEMMLEPGKSATYTIFM